MSDTKDILARADQWATLGEHYDVLDGAGVAVIVRDLAAEVRRLRSALSSLQVMHAELMNDALDAQERAEGHAREALEMAKRAEAAERERDEYKAGAREWMACARSNEAGLREAADRRRAVEFDFQNLLARAEAAERARDQAQCSSRLLAAALDEARGHVQTACSKALWGDDDEFNSACAFLARTGGGGK